MPGCDSVGAAQRSYPTSEVRGSGQEEQSHVQGVVACGGTGGPRGSIPHSRSGGGGEEIPLVQGKEQRLCFAGAAMKRYPMFRVRETQVRW